jgi:hypothetical protein
MSYLEAFVVVALSIAAAVGASWLVGRSFSLDSRQRHHAVGSAVFSQVGVMLSVLLAFVFSEVWGEYRTTALAINGECAALHGAAMLSSGLPDGEGLPVIRAIETYAATVKNEEWPLMAQRQRSRQAAHDLQATLRLAASLNLTKPVEVATEAQVINLLTQAHANRETRTFELTQAAPPLMWGMLIAIAVLLTGFVAFAGAEYPAHLALAGACAGSVALVLVLVRMLDLPFEGALALPDTDFVKLFDQVTILAKGAAP